MSTLTQTLLIFALILGTVIQPGSCTSSFPLGYQPIPNIESGTFLTIFLAIISMSITGGYLDSYIYTYAKAKRSQPLWDRVYAAIYEMDYAINNPIEYGCYYFYYYAYPNIRGTTSLEIYGYSPQNFMNIMKVSLMIFDNDFYLFDEIFEPWGLYGFDYSVNNVISFTAKTTPYTVLKYMTYCEYASMDDTLSSISIDFKLTVSGTSFSSNLVLTGTNINYMYIEVRYLAVYPSIGATYGFSIETFDTLFSTSTFSTSFVNYNPTNSVFMMGIQRFEYSLVNDPANSGLSWKMTTSLGIPGQMMNIDLAMDDQFVSMRYAALMISFIRCPLGYDIRGTNRTNSQQQCFDSCYENEFLDYDTANNYLICTACGDPLCKTCQNPTQCSSCVDGYSLVETSQKCAPNVGFYIDSTSTLRPCSDNIPGCLQCNSNGANCNLCSDTYYPQGNTCVLCSTLFADCIKCNSTSCLDCLAPKVLINETLCSAPISPQPIVGPNAPRGPCTDPNCFECSATNVSECVVCKSTLYQLQNGKCNTVCGDGLIDGGDVCDDGNFVNFDGCSSDCKTLEDGFVCNKVPAKLAGYESTECYFGKVINLTVVSIEKPLTQNKVNLYFMNPEPKIAAWQQIDLNNELTQAFTLTIPRFDSGVPGYFFNFTASFVKSSDTINKLKLRSQKLSSQNLYSQSRLLQSSTSTSSTFSPELYEFILLEVMFSPDAPGSVPQPSQDKESLNHQTMSLSFDPKLSQRSVFTRSASPLIFTSSFTLKADDNQVIQYHDESYFKQASQIEFLSFVVGASCVVLMVIGLVSFCVDGRNSKQMLIALETSFVVQLTYFSLLGVGEVNPLFVSMATGLKFASGYDVMLGGEGVQNFRDLQGIGVTSVGMMSNVNLSFVVVVVCMVVGGILLLLDKFSLGKKKSETQFSPNQQPNQPHENQENALISQRVQSQKQQKLNNKDDHKLFQNTNESESKIQKAGKFLLFNAGFGFLFFYLYKYFFFISVQLKYGISQMEGSSLVILGGIFFTLILYIILLVWKNDLFTQFTLKLTGRRYKINTFDTLAKNREIPKDKIKNIQKKFAIFIENLPEDEKPQPLKSNSLEGPSINIKLWYFVVISIEHIVNMASIAFLSLSFSYVNMIPLSMYAITLVLLYKMPIYPSSNLYRLYSAQIIGMLIQGILLTRRILSIDITSDNAVGQIESSLSIYFPISIIILLFLLCAESFAFGFYGIRRIRCCELQTDWQKIEMNHNMKQKLEKFVIEELNQEFLLKTGQKRNSQINNNNDEMKADELDQEDSANYDDIPFMKQNSSFDSSDNRQFLDSPSKFKRYIKDRDNQSMAQSPDYRRNVLKKPKQNNMIDLDRPINQEITTHLLKKEIKEKLLSSRLQNRINMMSGFKDEKSHKSNKSFESTRSPARPNNSTLIGSESSNKVVVTKVSESKPQKVNANAKKIKEVDFMNSILLKNQLAPTKKVEQVVQEEIGYVYTDKRGYDVYEQFDMI